nr:uncharacterized protein LOC109157228 [Ipomoea batatas]
MDGDGDVDGAGGVESGRRWARGPGELQRRRAGEGDRRRGGAAVASGGEEQRMGVRQRVWTAAGRETEAWTTAAGRVDGRRSGNGGVGKVVRRWAPHKKGRRDPITFYYDDLPDGPTPHRDDILIAMDINGATVRRVFVDTRSSVYIMYLETFAKLGLAKENLHQVMTQLAGLTRDIIEPEGCITLPVEFGEYPRVREINMEFVVVNLRSTHNIILGRPSLEYLEAISDRETRFASVNYHGENQRERDINGATVRRVFVDTGSNVNIMYLETFDKLVLAIENLHQVRTPLVRFKGDIIEPEGCITLPVEIREYPRVQEINMEFVVVDMRSTHNIILGDLAWKI